MYVTLGCYVKSLIISGFPNSRERYEGDFSYCSCDSESCADSNKCYCTGGGEGGGVGRALGQSSQSLEYLRSPSQRTYSDRMRRAFEEHDPKATRNR